MSKEIYRWGSWPPLAPPLLTVTLHGPLLWSKCNWNHLSPEIKPQDRHGFVKNVLKTEYLMWCYRFSQIIKREELKSTSCSPSGTGTREAVMLSTGVATLYPDLQMMFWFGCCIRLINLGSTDGLSWETTLDSLLLSFPWYSVIAALFITLMFDCCTVAKLESKLISSTR